MEALNAALDRWQPFFAAELGAAAALGGLLFVGLSLNLAKILSARALANRGLLALMLLMLALLVAGRMLVPDQVSVSLGIQVVILGGIVLILGNAIEFRIWRSPGRHHRVTYLLNVVLLEFALVPYVIGGILLMRDDPTGLHLVATAMALSFVKAVVDAWVLLVEVNR